MMGGTTFGRIADTLSKEGSIWLESAFCKEHEGGALLFSNPTEVVTLSSLDGLKLFFRTLEEKLAEGAFLAGWMSYEAGYGFEEIFLSPSSSSFDGLTLPHSPLGWFGVYREPERFSAEEVAQLFAEDTLITSCCLDALSAISFNLSEEEYGLKLETIKEHIAAGNLYQVNFTGRYRFTFDGTATALFSALRSAQPSSYIAFINSGERTIISFSPELFFLQRGLLIETMPMKGTAPRGSTAEEDSRLKEGLARCKKNLAENLMIVDLLRNDLGRICKSGSVEAEGLFTTETWPTLHQMVSTIRGEQKDGVELYELFRALYPSGSITGAPKINAMKLIQTLEPEPRGIYTGTIGFITPNRDLVFSVAIRTIELTGNEGIYGSGGGIVWDSDPKEEYLECQLKAKILERQQSVSRRGTARVLNNSTGIEFSFQDFCQINQSARNFGLFESILWSGSYLWLEEHLERLAVSATALGFPCNIAAATLMLSQLEEVLQQNGNSISCVCRRGYPNSRKPEEGSHPIEHRFKVKLMLSFQGVFSISHEPIAMQNQGVASLCLAGHRTDSANLLLHHKTTARELYDRYLTLALQKGYDEVLFLNERGEITEGAISTLLIRKGSKLLTPPLNSALLNGIFRSYILSSRSFVSEKTIRMEDLLAADTIFIANSVRGLRPAHFTGHHIHYNP
jgi:para-aminobenzoate synthetase/4-amino-4-deoxychorismate lyase